MSLRRVLAGSLLAAALTVPAAIVWACTPQAQIGLDKGFYYPGDTVVIQGTNFVPNGPVAINLNGGPPLATTQATDAGYVRVAITLPSTAATGDSIVAVARTSTGEFTARQGLVIRERAAAPSTPGTRAAPQGGPAPAPAGPAAPTRSRTVSGRQRAGSRGSPPGREPAPAAGRAGARADARAATGGTGSAVARADAPRAESPVRAPGSSRTALAASRPSERSAGGDLWSGLRSSRAPALGEASAGSGGSPGPGGELVGALGLLALGLAALGIGVSASARRRRTARTAGRRDG